MLAKPVRITYSKFEPSVPPKRRRPLFDQSITPIHRHSNSKRAMLRLATTVLIRSRAATGGVPPRALIMALFTTVRGGGPERPPNDLPPASTVTGPEPDMSRNPLQARLTGDEVVSFVPYIVSCVPIPSLSQFDSQFARKHTHYVHRRKCWTRWAAWGAPWRRR